eukprot:COSAG02_NODE_10341_length_1964_cov_7.838606_3_plen_53_part_01
MSGWQSYVTCAGVSVADFTFQWIASSDNAHHNAGFCNYDWPVSRHSQVLFKYQ